MKMTLRAAVAGGLFLAAALTAYPSLAQDAGFDFWNVGDLQSGLSVREDESRALDRESEVTLHRTMIRAEIATDVIEGRTTFEEGAAQYAELNRSHAKALSFSRKTYAGESDDERAARQLVSHLRVHPHPKANSVAEAGVRSLLQRN